MPDMFFLSASGPEPVRSLQESLGTERILWTGRCAVAEYAFGEPASLPRWTLPEETGVAVTETRVVFVDPAGRAGGELHWLWPQHLRVQPGNRDTGRSATVTQIQLVCNGPAGAFPALVFAGGDLATVGDADRLANMLRQSIARFRVEHSGELGLAAPQARMLSRLVIGPEFNNYQGGEGQTVSLLGSLTVEGPISTGVTGPTLEVESISSVPVVDAAGWEQEPFLDEHMSGGQPGFDAYAAYAGGPGGYAGSQSTHAGDQIAYVGEQSAYVGEQSAYVGEQSAYAGEQSAYASEQAAHVGEPASYPGGPDGQPAEPGGYDGTLQRAYPGEHGGYPAEHAGHAGAQGGYPVEQGGYAVEQHAGYDEPHPYADYQPAPVPAPHPFPAPHPLPAAPPARTPQPEYTDLASRAADLAARVASLVSANAGAEQSLERYETQTTNLSSFLAEGDHGLPADERAESARRTAARFAGNSARARATGQRPVGDDQGTRHRND
ncbi:hypothetical protein [Actinoplanes sp. NPDC051411]|uniref:hypothetical protein n=1 Tax=Actinoplanes sp. NPDC051411 TaxID=3155522 RepID=UPI00344463E7